MEERICPVCNKVFYAPKDSNLLRCTFCDNVVFEGRTVKRVSGDLDFFMVVGNRRVKVRLRDFSSEGLGIDLERMPIKADSVMHVGIKELGIESDVRVVWIRESGHIMSCGLKML